MPDVVSARPAARADASMTLLREMTEQSLDPAYAEAAARTAARTTAERRHPRRDRVLAATLTAAGAAAAGLLLSSSVLALRAPGEGDARSALVADISSRSRHADEQARTATALRASVQRLQDSVLAGASDAPTASGDLLIAAGTTAVLGPGLVITLDDAPGARASSADPRVVDADDARLVQDVDLREVVNGLWQAGAEAIAVNDHRLTSTSAIRSAGGAILVDFRPLTPPFRIEAIGSPGRLDAAFALTRGASWLQGLREQVGIPVTVSGSDHLRLPAAETQQLFAARVPSASTSSTPASSRSVSSTPTSSTSVSSGQPGAADDAGGTSMAPPAGSS